MNSQTLDRVPAHLREFVVVQDYDAYDEIDQAVWRFTMLQAFNQLKHSAHESYVKGLAQTGLSIDRIPRVEEMDRCLSEFGWGAVAVYGFIPPRAFQEFQALGILAINAPIRTWDHLAYTPAPDIIHEAAGHAPIIPDPTYRAFLTRFGRLGRMAFASREDFGVYEAIRVLSDLKENTSATAAELVQADERLLAALDNVRYTSEATFLTRLHWWTVEYGLIGTPHDYKSYGAGILSSISESIMLHLPEVRKLRLRARCVETDYDITERQPQLFVVENFAQLDELLDQVTADFAFRVGGKLALQRFQASGEVGTLCLNNGLQVIGVLGELLGEAPDYLRFSGPCALALDDRILDRHGRDRHADGFGSPLGRLADGTSLSTLSEYDLGRYNYKGPGSRVTLVYQSGVRVEGNLVHSIKGRDGNLLLLTFQDCRVTLGDRLLFDPAWGDYDLAIGESVPSAYAGAADPSYWPETRFSGDLFPKRKRHSATSERLLCHYREFAAVADKPISKALPIYENLGEQLLTQFPDQWLLAWMIMEKLVGADRGLKLASRLKTFMLEIEKQRPKEIPVTMGLKYLGLA